MNVHRGRRTPASRAVVTCWSSISSKRSRSPEVQKLKGQGLRWRVEGEPGLAEERVDEVGPALDGPEAAAGQGLQFVQCAGGVVAQSAFHDGPGAIDHVEVFKLC